MSNNTATIKIRKKFSFYKDDNNDSSTGSYIICVGIFRVSGSFESIICTNGSVRFSCTDWGVCVWTGYRSDDRIDKEYITASVNINRRNW